MRERAPGRRGEAQHWGLPYLAALFMSVYCPHDLESCDRETRANQGECHRQGRAAGDAYHSLLEAKRVERRKCDWLRNLLSPATSLQSAPGTEQGALAG
jgi:hypothetical protein